MTDLNREGLEAAKRAFHDTHFGPTVAPLKAAIRAYLAHTPATDTAALVEARVEHHNGKRWHIVGRTAAGEWHMQPVGHVTADEARMICERAVAALSTVPAKSTEPGEAVGAWDQRYRQLKAGEIILPTDEVLTDSHLGWQPPGPTVGHPAPDPAYTSHRWYRRLKSADHIGDANEMVAASAGGDGEKPGLRDAAENAVIAFGMGWDMEGVIERLKAALEASPPAPAAVGEGAEFRIGDHVEKVTGDYTGPGIVRGIATLDGGKVRYLVSAKVEGGSGEFLHIYTAANLRAVNTGGV